MRPPLLDIAVVILNIFVDNSIKGDGDECKKVNRKRHGTVTVVYGPIIL
jgi:hypothetical protein